MKKDTGIAALIDCVSLERIKHDLFYLSHDPLPSRVLNYRRPQSQISTLHETDKFIVGRLESLGYTPERERVRVQAFQPDPAVPHGFRKPLPDEPWYDAFNLYVHVEGAENTNETIVALAHKDSQSWLSLAPGAHDNATGTVAVLEIARLLRDVSPRRSVLLLWCNEEHWPWTSVHAATQLASSDRRVTAAINVDSIGGGSVRKNVTRYTTPEGERIADLTGIVNDLYGLALDQSKAATDLPNDDDGSFINAGIPAAVLNIGSIPYAEPNYHTEEDKPENVDIETVAEVTRLTLATILHLAG